MSIGENIKKARKQKGITQKELSEKIGKGFSTVQKYEIDVIVPPISIINKIAEVLEVPLCSLIMEEGECSQIRKKLPEGSENKNIPPE